MFFSTFHHGSDSDPHCAQSESSTQNVGPHSFWLNFLIEHSAPTCRARMLDKIKTDAQFCGEQLACGHFLLYHQGRPLLRGAAGGQLEPSWCDHPTALRLAPSLGEASAVLEVRPGVGGSAGHALPPGVRGGGAQVCRQPGGGGGAGHGGAGEQVLEPGLASTSGLRPSPGVGQQVHGPEGGHVHDGDGGGPHTQVS